MVAVAFTLLSTSPCVMNHVPNVYFVLSAALTLFTLFPLTFPFHLCGLVGKCLVQTARVFAQTPTLQRPMLMSGEKPLSMRSHLAASAVPRLMNLILSPREIP